jgi:hypothetical protein
MRSPNYSVKDLFYWGGLIAGMGIGTVGMRHLGYGNGWLPLIVGLCLGVALGYTLEKIYTSGQQPPDDYPL